MGEYNDLYLLFWRHFYFLTFISYSNYRSQAHFSSFHLLPPLLPTPSPFLLKFKGSHDESKSLAYKLAEDQAPLRVLLSSNQM